MPGQLVDCAPFNARIPAKTCAARHLAREPSGAGKDWPIFETCARCEVGAARADELERTGYRPRAYRVDPWRLKKQRDAMARAARDGLLTRIPTLDEGPPGEE